MVRRENAGLKDAIFRVCGGSEEAITAPAVLEELAKFGGPLVSERQVGRYLLEWRSMNEQAKLPYREVRWPETFERGHLPPQSARAVLELMRSLPSGRRPSIRMASRFWFISEAMPETPVSERLSLAFELMQFVPGTTAAESAARRIEARILGWVEPEPVAPKPNEVAWEAHDVYLALVRPKGQVNA